MFCIANALGSENIEFYSEGEKKKQNEEFCVGGVMSVWAEQEETTEGEENQAKGCQAVPGCMPPSGLIDSDQLPGMDMPFVCLSPVVLG